MLNSLRVYLFLISVADFSFLLMVFFYFFPTPKSINLVYVIFFYTV